MPLKHSGQAVHFIAGKPAQIAPRLMGHHPMQTTVAQVAAIADAQAKLHVALQDFPLSVNIDVIINTGQVLQSSLNQI